MSRVCGGVSPADVTDPETIAVFKRAVGVHNSTNNDNVEFVELVSATQQVVSGFSFTGVIKASKGGNVSEYKLKFWEKAGGNEIEVQEFVQK
jgi:hypothetical protein